MKITITIKVTPESRDEAIHHFGALYRECRTKLEEFIERGILGPSDKITARWLVETGRWE